MKACILLLSILGMIAIIAVTGGTIKDPHPKDFVIDAARSSAADSDIEIHSGQKHTRKILIEVQKYCNIDILFFS